MFANRETEKQLPVSQPASSPWAVISKAPGVSLPVSRPQRRWWGRVGDVTQQKRVHPGSAGQAPCGSARPCLAHTWEVAGPQQEWVPMGDTSFEARGHRREPPLPWRFCTPAEDREGQGNPWPEALGKQAGPLHATDAGGLGLSGPPDSPLVLHFWKHRGSLEMDMGPSL